MKHATAIIEKKMKEEGFKLAAEEDGMEGASYVMAGFTVENGPDVAVMFISQDDDNDVSVRLFGLAHVPEEKKLFVYPVLNQLSEQYRFIKFIMDGEGYVNIEYDFLTEVSDECLGDCCCEIFVRIMKIVDEAYPVLMKALRKDVSKLN